MRTNAWLASTILLCSVITSSRPAANAAEPAMFDGCCTSPDERFCSPHVSGWVMQGMTWNRDNPADGYNGPVGQNDRSNEYQLNQVYMSVAVPAESETGSVSVGFQTDVLFGTDAYFFHALGLDDRIVSDRTNQFYKVAIPQLYAEIYTPIGPGVTFQVGKWFALVGYESGLDSDFFYSKALGFNITPYSHTGVLASFDLNDQISISHGVHRGSDVWKDNNNDLGFTSLISWTSPDSDTTLTFATNVGPEQDERHDWQDIDGAPGPDSPGRNLNRVIWSATLETQLTDNLQYVLNHDYFFQNGSATFGIADAEAYGVTQYLFYQLNETVTAGLRCEVYRDDDGFVGSGFRSENAAAPGLYTNLTAGLEVRPCECLVVRPEVRWDWQQRDNPGDTPAFFAGTSDRQFLCSLSAVLSF